jgi:hypothetical protein
MSTRDTLKAELLSLVAECGAGGSAAPDLPEIVGMIDTLAPLSPVPDPANHLPLVAGSWTSLFASFGTGHSRGKMRHDDSTLSLQTFRAFPDIPIHVKDIIQEIGVEPRAYNNVIVFETMDRDCEGLIVIHGSYEGDAENRRRFRVVFHGAELRGLKGADDATLRTALGLPADFALKREFKPAKLYSDVVYLDDTTRINIGGMGGVYVLERRLEPALSL